MFQIVMIQEADKHQPEYLRMSKWEKVIVERLATPALNLGPPLPQLRPPASWRGWVAARRQDSSSWAEESEWKLGRCDAVWGAKDAGIIIVSFKFGTEINFPLNYLF